MIISNVKAAYDVVVLGGGPGGLTVACQLASLGIARVALFEQGSDLSKRSCPVLLRSACPTCRQCDLLRGIGGASGLLGGKLCFFPAGRRLAAHCGYTAPAANIKILELLEQIGFATAREQLHRPIAGSVERVNEHVQLRSYDALPLLREQMIGLFSALVSRALQCGVTLVSNAAVEKISCIRQSRGFVLEVAHDRDVHQVFASKAVVLATGRSTWEWLKGQLANLGASTMPGTVDVGVRVEVPSAQADHLLLEWEDPKVVVRAGAPDEVRTLCWCRGGEMSITNIDGNRLVDGHFGDRRKPFTSVSLVARMPAEAGRANLERALEHFKGHRPNRDPLHQTLAGFMRASAPVPQSIASPPIAYRCEDANLREVMSLELRTRVLGLLEELDAISSGELLRSLAGRVYGPVVDNLWGAPRVDRNLMTNVPGLYLAGDITGLGRGIIQAIFAGLVIADAIVGEVAQREDSLSVRGGGETARDAQGYTHIRSRGKPAKLLE